MVTVANRWRRQRRPDGHIPVGDGATVHPGHESVLLRGFRGGRARALHSVDGLLPAGRLGLSRHR